MILTRFNMKYIRYGLFILVLVCIVTACKHNFYTQRKNDLSDKREAEKVMGLFYGNLILEQKEENIKFYSEKYLEVSDQNEINRQTEVIENKLGKVIGKELKSWETSVVTGMNPKAEYLLVFDVEREKHNSVETYYLMKDPDDSIRIYSNSIDSKGFLMEDDNNESN